MNEAPLLLSVRDAAKVAGVGRDAMYQFVRCGRIRTVQIRSRRLVPRVELERWIERELMGGSERD